MQIYSSRKISLNKNTTNTKVESNINKGTIKQQENSRYKKLLSLLLELSNKHQEKQKEYDYHLFKSRNDKLKYHEYLKLYKDYLHNLVQKNEEIDNLYSKIESKNFKKIKIIQKIKYLNINLIKKSFNSLFSNRNNQENNVSIYILKCFNIQNIELFNLIINSNEDLISMLKEMDNYWKNKSIFSNDIYIKIKNEIFNAKNIFNKNESLDIIYNYFIYSLKIIDMENTIEKQKDAIIDLEDKKNNSFLLVNSMKNIIKANETHTKKLNNYIEKIDNVINKYSLNNKENRLSLNSKIYDEFMESFNTIKNDDLFISKNIKFSYENSIPKDDKINIKIKNNNKNEVKEPSEKIKPFIFKEINNFNITPNSSSNINNYNKRYSIIVNDPSSSPKKINDFRLSQFSFSNKNINKINKLSNNLISPKNRTKKNKNFFNCSHISNITPYKNPNKNSITIKSKLNPNNIKNNNEKNKISLINNYNSYSPSNVFQIVNNFESNSNLVNNNKNISNTNVVNRKYKSLFKLNKNSIYGSCKNNTESNCSSYKINPYSSNKGIVNYSSHNNNININSFTMKGDYNTNNRSIKIFSLNEIKKDSKDNKDKKNNKDNELKKSIRRNCASQKNKNHNKILFDNNNKYNEIKVKINVSKSNTNLESNAHKNKISFISPINNSSRKSKVNASYSNSKNKIKIKTNNNNKLEITKFNVTFNKITNENNSKKANSTTKLHINRNNQINNKISNEKNQKNSFMNTLNHIRNPQNSDYSNNSSKLSFSSTLNIKQKIDFSQNLSSDIRNKSLQPNKSIEKRIKSIKVVNQNSSRSHNNSIISNISNGIEITNKYKINNSNIGKMINKNMNHNYFSTNTSYDNISISRSISKGSDEFEICDRINCDHLKNNIGIMNDSCRNSNYPFIRNANIEREEMIKVNDAGKGELREKEKFRIDKPVSFGGCCVSCT